ncbi:hypothetical protein [Altererythrobacter sp.]|uniref:hypothetical protein n=1 Tax=Altererythrobacter sp. TaxID=1872480 RepID=UPI001B22F618|nr:hypothetical protein [Altererythrobacter sp.]MBO6609854.1 hypothetical protein [Altererythrobacter sp.]MBO6642210.1 hypothetical protein [Altererythrobacter sp.]MBO6709282.1 hypothetical protein [Altererythrobacter sp.]
MTSALGRLWGSPGLTSITATGARAAAFFVPVPFISAAFDTSVVALWFLIITFQSLTALAIGNLPIILMHMVAHARADTSASDERIAKIALGIRRVFNVAVIIYITLAIFLFTPLLWRQISLTGDQIAAFGTWSLFVAGMVCRIRTLPYTTYLLGLNEVALVRRMEAISWLVGGIGSAIGLMVWANLVWAMALMQAPAIINLISMKMFANRKKWGVALARRIDGDAEIWSELRPRAIRGAIGVIAAYLTVYGSSIIYAQFGDSASIASFSFTVTLFGLISQLANSQTMSALPAMSGAYAARRLDEMRAIARKTMTRSLVLYLAMTIIIFTGLSLVAAMAPRALPVLETRIWILFGLAHLVVRYASFHLHFYTITNDIKWHIYHLGTAAIYFPLIVLFGPASPATYPIALLISASVFSAPYARRQSLVKFEFKFSDERPQIILSMAATLAATALLLFYK